MKVLSEVSGVAFPRGKKGAPKAREALEVRALPEDGRRDYVTLELKKKEKKKKGSMASSTAPRRGRTSGPAVNNRVLVLSPEGDRLV